MRRTVVVSLAVTAILAAGFPSTAAAAPPTAHAASPGDAVVARPARSSRQPAKLRLRVPKRRGAVAGASAFADAWSGSGAACIGTATTLSIGRQFGLPAGTYFTWRSRLWMYNPRTGVQGWSNWSGTVSDRVTPGSYLLPGGIFVMGPSGGINPAPSPQITWTVSRGWWVMPYAQVIGYGERPVNYGYVASPNAFSQPNWCYIA
jgi:hypothetical protein